MVTSVQEHFFMVIATKPLLQWEVYTSQQTNSIWDFICTVTPDSLASNGVVPLIAIIVLMKCNL